MVKLMILFKTASQGGDFDRRYAHNLRLLRTMPGVKRIEESVVLGGPVDDAVSYHRVLEVYFSDFKALDAALVSEQGTVAGKDLMDFAGQNVELLFVEETGDPLQQKPLGPKNLQAYLDDHDIAAEIVYPGEPTPNVPAAAEALGVEPDQIVKSLIFLVHDKLFLIYGCGTRRVDMDRLAERLHVSREHIRLADADEVLELSGYAVGTVPPLGLKTPMPAFMDPAVEAQDVVYAGGGGISALLKIAPADLLKASRAEVAPMLEDEDGSMAPD